MEWDALYCWSVFAEKILTQVIPETKELGITKRDLKIEAMEQILLRVYNDGFIEGEIDKGEVDVSIDKALKEIIVIIGAMK